MAVARLTDDAVLVEVACRDTDTNVARSALLNLRDTSLFVQVAGRCRIVEVRNLAIERLKDAGVLAELAAQHQDPSARLEAGCALAGLADKRALDAVLLAFTDPKLSTSMQQGMPGSRARAARCLALLRDPVAIGPLAAHFGKDDVFYVHNAVADALVEFGETAVPALLERKQDPEPSVRRTVAVALQKIAARSLRPGQQLNRMQFRAWYRHGGGGGTLGIGCLLVVHRILPNLEYPKVVKALVEHLRREGIRFEDAMVVEIVGGPKVSFEKGEHNKDAKVVLEEFASVIPPWKENPHNAMMDPLLLGWDAGPVLFICLI